jgi:hypothetical protein
MLMQNIRYKKTMTLMKVLLLTTTLQHAQARNNTNIDFEDGAKEKIFVKGGKLSVPKIIKKVDNQHKDEYIGKNSKIFKEKEDKVKKDLNSFAKIYLKERVLLASVRDRSHFYSGTKGMSPFL